MLFLFFEGLAFTASSDAKPLGQAAVGNPALVCYAESLPPDAVLFAIGRLAQSPMTVFIAPEKGGESFALRYISPNGTELDLCGHATLASTFFLKTHVREAAAYRFKLNPAFHTARFELGGLTSPSEIGFSTRAYRSAPYEDRAVLARVADALDIAQEEVEAAYVSELKDYILVLKTNAGLRRAKPNFAALIELGETVLPHRAFALSAPSTEPGFDYEARLFAPLLGINEDIACGSANCSMAPIWAKRLGRERLKMFYVTPDEAGRPIVGGVQDVTLGAGRLTIRSNVTPVWSRAIASDSAESLLRDPAFLALMQKVGKAPEVKTGKVTASLTQHKAA